MRFDLHMHTVHSDGELAVLELLERAKEKNLSGLSITDHDTIGAYPEAFKEGEKLGLKVLSGIEISCLHQNTSVHILGYSFNIDNSGFNQFIEKCQQQREDRNLQMIEKLNHLKIDISKEDLIKVFNKPISQMGRPHLAKLLVEKGVCSDFQSAFNRYLKDGGPCYVVGYRPKVEEALEALHQANAFAVLAHPHLMDNKAVLNEVLKMPLDGLECYYAKFMPQKEKKWVEIAEKQGWLKTGGSDFHETSRVVNDLGSSWVSEETFEILYQRQRENEL